jgi:hypothetical protein
MTLRARSLELLAALRPSRVEGAKSAISIASRSRSLGSPCTDVIACSGIWASSRRSAEPSLMPALDRADRPGGPGAPWPHVEDLWLKLRSPAAARRESRLRSC